MSRLTEPVSVTVALLRALYASHGYPFFTDGDYNLNVCGVRAAPRRVDAFDDALIAAWKVQGSWEVIVVPATTDPGLPYMTAPMNPEGTARVAPGFYRGLWKVGKRGDGRSAFVQVGVVKIQRDGDRNGVFDEAAPTTEGLFGIHLHAPATTGVVGRSSAGCQVPRTAADFGRIYSAGTSQFDVRGWDRVSYALFDAKDDPLAAVLVRAVGGGL